MIGTDIKAMEERFSVLSALIKEDPFSLLPVFALPFFLSRPLMQEAGSDDTSELTRARWCELVDLSDAWHEAKARARSA